MRARKKWAITIIAFTVFVLIAVAGIYIGFGIFDIASYIASSTTTTVTTTQILSKFYPLTGVSIYDNVLFYTNTSPVGCISYAIVKNYAYNVTSQGLYLVNETKITNATAVEKLYNTIGNSDLAGSNQQELFMTENGTNDNYVIILQNQTLLCK